MQHFCIYNNVCVSILTILYRYHSGSVKSLRKYVWKRLPNAVKSILLGNMGKIPKRAENIYFPKLCDRGSHIAPKYLEDTVKIFHCNVAILATHFESY